MSHIKISKLKRTIEFVRKYSSVPICIDTKCIMDDKIFHQYCKLDNKLTPFATQLTGITQEMCDNGVSFKKSLICLLNNIRTFWSQILITVKYG